MAITPIAVSDNGTAVRGKLNAAIAKANEVDGKAAASAVAALTATLVTKADASAVTPLVTDAPITKREQVAPPERPGEAPSLWTSSLAGGLPESRPALASVASVADTNGRVIRLSGVGLVAPRRYFALEQGRIYQLRYAVQRRVNSPDPANDSVRCGIAWYTASLSQHTTAGSVAQDINDLVTGDARTVVTATISSAAGDNVDIVAPAGARFFAPYVQSFGVGSQTDVEVLSVTDVTDAVLFAPDVSALQAALDGLLSANLGGRIEALEEDAESPNTRTFRTLSDFLAATIPVSVNRVRVLYGFVTEQSFEPALADDYDHQGADNRYWKVFGYTVDIRALGLVGGNTPADGPKFKKAENRVAVGGTLVLPMGQWYTPSSFHRDDISIVGVGVPSLAEDEGSYVAGSGTIILGKLNCYGDRMHIDGFGVDAGADFLGVAAATDGLVFSHPLASIDGSELTDCSVGRVSGLCKNSTDPIHGCLIQGHNRLVGDYARGDLGAFGAVLKARNSRFNELDGYHSGTSCSILKSDWYATCDNTWVGKFSGIGLPSTIATAVIHAATAGIAGLKVDLIDTDGGLRNLQLISAPLPEEGEDPVDFDPEDPETPGTYPFCALTGFNIKTMRGRGATMRCFDTAGGMTGRVDTMDVRAEVAEILVITDVDTQGIDFGQIYASGPAENVASVFLAGRFTAQNIIALVDDDFSALNGIYLAPEDGKFQLGSYVGKLFYNTDDDALLNGWTTVSGFPLTGRLELGRVSLGGRLVPPVRNDANNTACLIPYRPLVDAKIPVLAHRSGGPPVMVIATVSAAGGVYFEHFVTGLETYFPADVTYVSLDGVTYPV